MDYEQFNSDLFGNIGIPGLVFKAKKVRIRYMQYEKDKEWMECVSTLAVNAESFLEYIIYVLEYIIYIYILEFDWKYFVLQAPVVQRLDNAIQRINRYPVDKC